MLTVEKPGTPEEMVHFGTKGMKWGVHKTRGTQEFFRQNPTSSQRTAAIERARVNVKAQKKAIRGEKDPVKKQKLKDMSLNSPDRATALRMTRGEKVVNGMLYTLVPIPIIPAAVAVSGAVRVGRRRALEEKAGKG